MGLRKSLACTLPLPEKKVFIRKKLIDIRSPPNKKKYIFSFLTTILLWCMGLFQSHSTLAEKKNSGYYYGTSDSLDPRFLNLTRPSPRKYIFSFFTTVLLWCTWLWKISISSRPNRKKKLFLATLLFIEIYFIVTILLWCKGLGNYWSVLC